MTGKEKKFLADILNSIELIEAFLKETTSFEDYVSDLKTKSAVERQLGIIGEAINKFLKEDGNNAIENAKQIISLRNRLVHSYDTIDDSIIWSILALHLKPLRLEVGNLLHGE
jgi:uncharacterized protein with HEPN domain